MKDLKLPRIFPLYLFLTAAVIMLIHFDSAYAKIESPQVLDIASEILICIQPVIWLCFIKSYIKHNNSRFFLISGIIIIYSGTFLDLMDEFYKIEGLLINLEDILIGFGLVFISAAIIINFLEEEKSKLILSQKTKAIYNRSIRDPLTSLYNRCYLEEYLDTMLDKLIDPDSDVSVAFMDIDNFKAINDTYGHNRGDDLLKRIGTLINDSIRETDLAFRYGGDEFLIIYPNTEVDVALKVTEQIKDNLKRLSLLSNMSSIEFTLSSGVAAYRKSENYKDLIARADEAMYYSKKKRKGQIFSAASPQ